MIGKLGLQTFKVIDNIKFKESQRPYQTDGLPAYAVRYLDNVITDETEVWDLQHNAVIDFKSLISILRFNNMSKREQKKLLKENQSAI